MDYQDKSSRRDHVGHDDWEQVHNDWLTIQAKERERKQPAVVPKDDASEKEADDVAQKVTEGQNVDIGGMTGTTGIQRNGATDAPAPPKGFMSSLQSSKGGGTALDAETQSELGAKMNADFGDVRVHTGGQAAGMAGDINAKAFTHGQDVYFGEGQYNPGSKAGKELLAHELTHTVQQGNSGTALQLSRLKDYADNRAAMLSDADIRNTNEYKAYMNPSLVWQTELKATDQEAIKACRLILTAMQNGTVVNWEQSARKYLLEARGYYTAVDEAANQQYAQFTADATAQGKTVGEYLHDQSQVYGYGGGEATWWNGLSSTEQTSWMTSANDTIVQVKESIKGTSLEQLVTERGIVASPKECEELSAYAYYSDGNLHVGRKWIENAQKDPKNVWDNIAHELGGHFEYGTEMSSDIMSGVMNKMSDEEQDKANAGPRYVYSAYSYMETEIFAELREYDFRTAGSGGDRPEDDVPKQLKKIHQLYTLDVAKTIITNLSKRVHQATNIQETTKTFFDNCVQAEFGWKPE